MTDVSFNEEAGLAPQVATGKQPPFVRALIKLGVAKTDKEANLILIILAVAFFAAAIAVYLLGMPQKHAPAPEELQDTSPSAQQ